MPVNYAPPSPVAFAQSAASRLASGGGGGGGGGRGFYGPGPIVQLQDRTGELQNRLNLAAIDATVQTNLADQRFVQQSHLARQAAELNAWEFNQRVTTQEAAQLRADQNAIAAIDQDPTMTPTEKMQAKLQVKTRIDWVGQRQQRDLQQAQAQMAQQHAAAYKMQAALDEERMKMSAAMMTNKIKTLTDPTKGPELAELVRDMDMDPVSPEGIQMMDKLALARGWTQTFAVNSKNEIEGKPLFVGQGITAAAGGEAGQGSQKGTQGGREESKERDRDIDFAETALKFAQEDAKNAPGTDVMKKAAEYQKYLEENAQKRRAARDPQELVKKSREESKASLTNIDEVMKDLPKRGDLTDRNDYLRAASRAKQLLEKYKSTHEMPPEVYQTYLKHAAKVASIPERPEISAIRKIPGQVFSMLGKNRASLNSVQESNVQDIVRQIRENPSLSPDGFNASEEVREEVKRRLKE